MGAPEETAGSVKLVEKATGKAWDILPSDLAAA